MEEALEQIGRDGPDLLLADIGLPGMSGTEGIGLLKRRYPARPALVLTVYEDDERIFNALCAGACGYLLGRAHVVAGGQAGDRVVPRLSRAGEIR
jgi:DNA-binding NarL/FixJ family response regulator